MTGDEFRAMRDEMKLTQARLGEKLGITGAYVGELERGEKTIDRRTELAVRYLAMTSLGCERFSLHAEPQEDGLVKLILYRTTDPGPMLEFKPVREMLIDYPHAVEALGHLALAVEAVRPKEQSHGE